MKELVRFRRRNAEIWRMRDRIQFPVLSEVKNQFVTASRMHCLSQAELGSVVVMHYLANQVLCSDAVTEYQQAKAELEGAFLRDQEAQVLKVRFDRTFGGFFKTSFPEDE